LRQDSSEDASDSPIIVSISPSPLTPPRSPYATPFPHSSVPPHSSPLLAPSLPSLFFSILTLITNFVARKTTKYRTTTNPLPTLTCPRLHRPNTLPARSLPLPHHHFLGILEILTLLQHPHPSLYSRLMLATIFFLLRMIFWINSGFLVQQVSLIP
jgi:hypothetical protein